MGGSFSPSLKLIALLKNSFAISNTSIKTIAFSIGKRQTLMVPTSLLFEDKEGKELYVAYFFNKQRCLYAKYDGITLYDKFDIQHHTNKHRFSIYSKFITHGIWDDLTV